MGQASVNERAESKAVGERKHSRKSTKGGDHRWG